jgi:3-oxoacyl-[acyl-carrier protein] reductase
MNQRFDLIGRTVIITGGGKGIGKVYSEEFAKAGAHVVAADIDGAAAKSVAEALVAQGLQAVGLATDIASEASTKAMAEAAIEAFGAIDVLVNNASLMSVLARRSWLDIPVEEWDRVMAVNLRGMFLSCRAVFPAMKAQGQGKIVNISSSRVWEGTPNRLHYTTSKAGVIGFTRALAREVGEFGVTVNAVTPGMTQSETQVQSSSENYLATRVAGRAIERVQVPADLVGAVMFLSSAASDFMTGQTISGSSCRLLGRGAPNGRTWHRYYFALMRAFSITSFHFGTSSAMRLPNVCGPRPVAAKPALRSLSRTSGRCAISSSAFASRSTTSAGVPVGTSMPCQGSETDSGTPASATVGMSGRSGQRSAPVTASPFRLPDCICGMATEIDIVPTSTVFDSSAWAAGAAPAYGMCTMSIPARCLRSSVARCGAVPGPGVE